MRGRGLSFEVLMAYTGGETRRWYDWFSAQPPEVLDLPIGEGRTATIRGMLIHIFAVELRYAERLVKEEVTPYEALDTSSLDAIFRIGARAREKLEQYLSGATDEDFATVLTFQTMTAGTLSASARTIVGHFFLHGIRHWAQLATALRQAGYRQQWPHDFIFA